MQQGRKSNEKYKKKFCKAIIEYFRKDPYVLEVKKEYFADGSIRSAIPSIQATEFPTFQGFADSINVHIDTLHEWANKYPEFSEAYKRAKQLQEKLLSTKMLITGVLRRLLRQHVQRPVRHIIPVSFATLQKI